MKNLMKRILALSLAVLLLMVCSGCDLLDKAKANQAFLQPDGSIVWNGATYMALPPSEYLVVDMDLDTQITVTDEGVPVLAGLLEGKFNVYPSDDRRFLSVYDYFGGSGTIYCQKPMYEAMVQRLTGEFQAEKMGYFYNVMNEEGELESEFQSLTAAQMQMLTDVTANVEPQSGNQVGLPQAIDKIYLYECSEDMLLQRCRSALVLAGNTYYLFLYEEQDTLFFPVPEGCNAEMTELFEDYMKISQEALTGKPESQT